MARALELARKGTALAHPNPMVGAVVVREGRVLGEGFHIYEDIKHAEILALERAGRFARGATLYVTLEPCCHTGRTGPCASAIVDAGIRRVVAAMPDPNPRVAGRSFAMLRRAGIEVTTGTAGDDAQRLNESFAKWIRTGLPFLTLKTASTLDGQIASRRGSTTWITSRESRARVQQIRHAADALVTGIGTVLKDDPRMTDRSGLPRWRPLLRVVLDSHLRLPLRSKLVRSAARDLLVIGTPAASPRRALALEKAGVEVLLVRQGHGRTDLRNVLRELGRRQLLSVLLEAGSALNGAAITAGIVDRLIVFYAPLLLGAGNVPIATLPFITLASAPRITNLHFERVGPDFMLEGRFHVHRNH
jgi:diaminohydroxyphosphoribosylaminopyrimidine deaminase / 5-amino-6-(5-phosphoribosylamino)uracil reductase